MEKRSDPERRRKRPAQAGSGVDARAAKPAPARPARPDAPKREGARDERKRPPKPGAARTAPLPAAKNGKRPAPVKHETKRNFAPKPSTKKAAPAAAIGPGDHPRAGRVALIGRPNVGKSTLLNAALDQPLAIVSPTPQTTRDAILGVVHQGDAEIALLDTPGLHRPRTELGRVMNQTAREAARSADVVVFVTDVPNLNKKPRRGRGMPEGEAAVEEEAEPAANPPRALAPHPGDLTLLADIGEGTPTVLVVNKVDRLKDKEQILPLLEAFAKVRDFAAVVPISALRKSGISRVLDEVSKLLPAGPWRYDLDDITDRPMRFFAAEYVREQILRATQAEVPHAVAVAIERFAEPPGEGGTLHIDATIWVERPGQKRIVIGAAGEMLKKIGTYARLRIEELAGRKVNLKLWVRVTPAWRESRPELNELGYSGKQSAGGEEVEIHAELPGEGDDDDEGGEDDAIEPSGEEAR